MTVHQLFPAEDRFTNRKTIPANTSHEPQFVPEAPMIMDAMPEDFGPNVNTCGVEYVSTRQMCWACVVLAVVLVAVSLGPWWL